MNKLLFLSHRIPYPPDKGDKIRAWNMLRHLMRTHRVFVGCLVDDEADWAHVPALRAQCEELACFRLRPRWQKLRSVLRARPGRPLTLDYFGNAGLQRWVDATLARERIDRVFVFCSAMAPYVLRARQARRILDMIDVDSSKWTEYAGRSGWPARAVWSREGRTLLAFERRAVRAFDHTLFVSDHELQHFRALAPEAAGRTSAVSNGVDFRYFAPDAGLPNPLPADRPAIVFTGAMDYRPNIDAVTWFARAVLPRLTGEEATGGEATGGEATAGRAAGAASGGGPAPSFWIVGANPAEEVRALAADPRVHVTGRVPDTRPYLAHAAVVVAPLRIARGIQNKVLEAMAMARPVVATPQAFAGIDAVPGRDLLLAETDAEMATAIAAVIDGRHPGIGAAARRAVEARYDWAATLAPLDALWRPDNTAPAPTVARRGQPQAQVTA